MHINTGNKIRATARKIGTDLGRWCWGMWRAIGSVLVTS